MLVAAVRDAADPLPVKTGGGGGGSGCRGGRIEEAGAPVAAVAAAVLAGEHRDFPTAQKKMTSVKDIEYKPIPANRKTYDKLYRLYLGLHDAFGGVAKTADLSGTMKGLLAIKQTSRL